MHSRYQSRRQPRWGTLLLVVLLHLAVLAALVRVFAPSFTTSVVERATSLVTVTVTAPPDPDPAPEVAAEPDGGASGAEAPAAVAREVTAPPAPLPRPSPAPRAASTGTENLAGAGEQGTGTGAGGTGAGPGGGSGAGSGSGARPLALISGRIDDARDYPRGGRGIRRGHDVIVELTVSTDGRVSACRITDPSPDPEADAITCRLATERFVFRPRLDAAGEPVVGTYRWRQRWF